jgi:type II secretion system protein G
MHAQEYFYRDKEGRGIGPLALDALAKFRLAGVLGGDTPVRAADSADWKPCRDIIADAPASPPATPAPTAPAFGGSSTSRMKWVIVVLAAIAVVLVFRYGISGTPSASDGERAIQARIKAESEGRIKLTKFHKTNAQQGELFGVKLYDLEFEAEIEFTENCKWITGLMGMQAGFRTSKPAAQQSSGFSWNKWIDDTQNPGVVVTNGQRLLLTGVVSFEKKEKGWLVNEVKLKSSKVVAGSPDVPTQRAATTAATSPPESPAKSSENNQIREKAERGDASAQSQLGVMYWNGLGVEKNYPEALKWLRKAADQGEAEAEFYLGFSYALGTGVEKNEAQAVKWYQKAADHGNAQAQVYLARALEAGNGTRKDAVEAVKWYQKAAEKGDSQAQEHLGEIYDNGWGVPRNQDIAVDWYRKAAKAGSKFSEARLGEIFPSDAAEAARVASLRCVNNLKQVGLAFKLWSGDNGDRLPFNVPVKEGGTRELCDRGADGFDKNSHLHFLVMSNEVAIPKLLVCPADTSKRPARDFRSELRPENVTYKVRTVPTVSESSPGEVLAICPIHHYVLYCDGTVTTVGGSDDASTPNSRQTEAVSSTGIPGQTERLALAARTQVATFRTAINMFEVDNGYFPKSLEDLVSKPQGASNWHGPYLDSPTVPLDPWGHAYIYEHPGKHNPSSYDVMSMGPDGRVGGGDDITNWLDPEKPATTSSSQTESGMASQNAGVRSQESATLQESSNPALNEAVARLKWQQCQNNLKQIHLALRLWSGDNKDFLPRDFQSVSNELSTPKILICPADESRSPVSHFTDLSDRSVSYRLLVAGADGFTLKSETVCVACLVHRRGIRWDGAITDSLPDTALLPSAANPSDDAADSYLIEPHLGVGKIRAGMTAQQVIEQFGQPGSLGMNLTNILSYYTLGFSAWVGRDGFVMRVLCGSPTTNDDRGARAFKGRTKEGIGMGSTRADLVKAFGEPSSVRNDGAREFLSYRDSGLAFTLTGGAVHQITVDLQKKNSVAVPDSVDKPSAPATPTELPVPKTLAALEQQLKELLGRSPRVPDQPDKILSDEKKGVTISYPAEFEMRTDTFPVVARFYAPVGSTPEPNRASISVTCAPTPLLDRNPSLEAAVNSTIAGTKSTMANATLTSLFKTTLAGAEAQVFVVTGTESGVLRQKAVTVAVCRKHIPGVVLHATPETFPKFWDDYRRVCDSYVLR